MFSDFAMRLKSDPNGTIEDMIEDSRSNGGDPKAVIMHPGTLDMMVNHFGLRVHDVSLYVARDRIKVEEGMIYVI